MTDELIEKALDIHKVFGNCKNCPYYEGKPVCSTRLLRDVSDYINRLKAKSAILKKNADEAFQQGLNEMKELVAPEFRKETAKEILQKLKFLYKERTREYTNWDGNKVQAATFEWLNADIDELAKEYGVEVEG